MKKITISLTALAFVLMSATFTQAAISQSKSYKVSVTVPASVGITAHPHTVWPVLKRHADSRPVLQTEETVRENEMIILKSYVVK